jgi:hypothetical protein
MGGKSTTSTQTVSIPPEVMARYNAVNARAENVAATPFQQYGGQFVAPLSSTQQAGVQNTNYAAGAAQPYYGAATGLTLSGAQDVGPLTQDQIAYYQNPYTQAVVDPTLQALRQQQGQQLTQQQTDAIRAGSYGGDRAGLQRAVLQGQQGLATAQAIAPLYQQGYGQAVQTAAGQQGVVASDLTRRMQAGQQLAGLGTGAQAALLQGAQAQLQAGGVEQQAQQADLTARYQQFLQERGYPFQVAQFLANIAMGTGALSGSTTTTEQPAGLFSDERLKHDAERVGYTDDGLPIYTYKYNGDNKTQMGVMAQDVEKKHPDAVGEARASDGRMYKTVDYEKLDAKERAYGGGLDVNSMGGAVMEPGAFARGGYALGGGLIGDTEMRSMMSNMKQPLGMYQQAALYGSTPYQTPYGPGLGIRGDAVPVPSLVTAGSLKSAPKGAVEQALSTYQTVKGLGDMGSGIYDLGERVSVGRPERKNDKGEVTQEKSSGFFGSEGKYDPKKGWFGKAEGGLVGRPNYQMGGDLPYAAGQQGYDPLAEVVKQGQQQRPSLPKPGEPPKPQEPLKDVMQTGMQMYSAGKMGSAALDKGKELVAKMGGEGGLTPIASGSEITAMPVPRPVGLGAAPVDPNAPAAGAKAIESTQAAANPAGTYTLPGTTETVTPGLSSGAAAPTSEALGAAATPMAETAAAAAPEALSVAAAPVAETAAGLAGAGEAAAGLAGAGEAAAGLAAGAEAAAAAVPAAAEILPMIAMMFSDRRLKDNIKAVGKTFDGQNIYSYNIGDGPTQMGLMAQEVAKKHPDAVGKRNGYMTVDYNEATEDAAHRGHFYSGGLVSRQGHADGERVIADYSEEADLPALGAVEIKAPADDRMSERMQSTLPKFREAYPDLADRITSGFRTPEQNQKAGGAKGSAHLEGNALDFSLRGLDPTQKAEVLQWWKDQGAGGFGYYPKSDSVHVDFGSPRAWGPNYSRTSLNQTPEFFQKFASLHTGQPVEAIRSITDAISGGARKDEGLGAAASKTLDKFTSAASGLVPTKKNERGEETTDYKRIIVPLLTGIAGMAAAPTRNFPTALAMGLGAGAQSYANLDKQQADIEKVQAEAKRETATAGLTDVQAQVAKSGLYPFEFERGFGWVLIDRSDPANPKRRLVYDQNGKPLTDPNITPDQARSKMGSLGEVVPSAGGAGGAGGTGKAETTAAPAKTTEFDPAKVVTKPVDESTLPVEKPIPGVRHVSTQIPEGYMPTDQAALSRQLKENASFGQEEFKKVQSQEAIAGAASKTLMQLDGMKRAYNEIAPGTLLTGTKYAPQVLDALKTIKGVANAFGGDISADLSNATAAAEWLQKEQFRLGAELQKGLGREPGFILQQMVNANPGANNTAIGFARIASGMEQAAIYEKDKADFLNNYYSKFGHLRDADQLFKKLNPIQNYVDRATYYAIPEAEREKLTSYVTANREKFPNQTQDLMQKFDKIYGKGSANIVSGVR